MKGLRLIYILLALLLALPACREKDDPNPVQPESNVYIDTLICVGGEANTYRFNFFSRNLWKATVEGGGEWCIVTPRDGGSGGATIGVKLADNYDSYTRTATVRITSATHIGTIVIKQEPLDILDLTSIDQSTFEAPGGSFVINVDANIGYSFKIDSPWIESVQTKALNHDKLHFTVGKNNEGVDRVARITFSGNEINRVVTITQHPALLDCDTRDTLVPQGGKTTPIRVKSNVSYDIVMPADKCLRLLESSFTEVTADGVETNNLYKFEMDANPEYYARECSVIFCNSDYNVSDTLTFTQTGVDLFASCPEPHFDFGPDSLSFIVDFDAGKQFDCYAGCDWITLEMPSEKPYRRIIHISQNRSGRDRSCRIALNDAGSAQAIDIFQERVVMDYSRRRFDYSVVGGRDTLFFKHNIDYELVRPDAEWCGIKEDEDGVFVLRIAETAEEQPRECRMIFRSEHFQIADTIVIHQDQKDVLRVSPQKLDVPSEGEEVEVHVHANIPYDYVIEGNPEWIRENYDKSSDSVKVFFVRRNSEDADRQAQMVFSGRAFKSVVTISQRHPTLVVRDTLVSFTDDGGTVKIGIDANVDCEVRTVPSEWLSAGIKDNLLEISAASNQGADARRGTVIVFNSFYGLADTVAVYQSSKDVFDLSQKQFQFGPYASTFSVKVRADIDYTYSVEEGCDWIKEGDKALSFDVSRNLSGETRVGRIIFTNGSSTTEVTVSQEAAFLKLSENRLEFDTAGGTVEILVESNVKYTVGMPSCFWLQTAQTAGGLKVTALENETEEWRATEVSVDASDFNLAVNLPVRQRQKDVFQLQEKEFSFAPKGGEFTVALHTNLDYVCTVEDQPVWLKSNGSLNFTVGKNTTEKLREAVIRIDAPGFSEMVNVMQEAPSLLVSADSCAVAAEGGTVRFTVASNIDYLEDLPTENWIARKDAEEGEYAFEIAENTVRSARECYVVFSTDYGLDHTVKIIQAASEKPDVPDEPDEPKDPYITIDETEFSFGPAGGTLPVSIKSNIEYTHIIDKSCEWIVEGGEPDTFVVEKNTSGTDRTSSIVFAGEGLRAVVNIIQEAAHISIPKTTYYLSGVGESVAIDVDSNIPFVVSLPDNMWLTQQTTSTGFEVTAASNPSSEAREGRFTVYNADYDVSQEIVVVQRPEGSILSTALLEFGPEGGASTVEVYADDYSYRIIDSPVWLRDYGGLKFAVDTNFTDSDLECFIKFVAGDATDSLKVVQKAPYLELIPESFDEIDAYGGRRSFTVRSNVDYRITASEWITVNSSDGTVLIDVAENIGYEERVCEITVTTDFEITRSYTFNQDYHVPPPPFFAKQDTFFVHPFGGEIKVEITPSEGAFYSEQQLPSYVLEDIEQHNDSTFVFVVDTAKTYREWGVTLKDVNGQKINLFFTQQSPSVRLSSSSRLIKAEGGESPVTVTSNIDYQIYMPEDQPWVSYRKGAKEGDYYFAAAPNTTGIERTASITVGDTIAGVFRVLKVVQRENIYLEVDPSVLRCDWDGGDLFLDLTSNADISVKSDLQWNEDRWFELSQTEKAGRYRITVDTNLQFKSRASTITCGAGNVTKVVEVRQNGYRKEGLYYSDDFSADRTVRTIQQAQKGNGLDLVLMGDAFSDRQIASGVYDSLINAAVEYLFDIEPYRSFRDLFNIYSVTVVSPTEVYEENAANALSTYFGKGTQVGGDETMVRYYAQAALSEERIQNAVMVVLMNKPVYAGTTYLKFGNEYYKNYGCGYAIAYIPLCTSPEQFSQVLQHEVGGHAFGKLEDEYAYERNGEIPYEEVANYRSSQRKGYYMNVDFVSDSASVLWSRFLYDENYKDEGLGAFEGACTYWIGAFRPTENSIMRYNTGGFNAPSREAIYYRMFRLAYGDDAEYDFADFVEYDAINRIPPTKSARSSRSPVAPPPGFIPLPHPVVIEN